MLCLALAQSSDYIYANEALLFAAEPIQRALPAVSGGACVKTFRPALRFPLPQNESLCATSSPLAPGARAMLFSLLPPFSSLIKPSPLAQFSESAGAAEPQSGSGSGE